MQGWVLGPISANVPGRKGVSRDTKAAALFGLLATAPAGQCAKEEIATHLWPGEPFSAQRVYWAVSDLRKRLGEEFVPRGNSGICAVRLPEASVDYLRFRSAVRKAADLKIPVQRFEMLSSALAEWADEEPLQSAPERQFVERKEQLRRERMHAINLQLEAAWQAREDKWLWEETEKLYRRMPEQETIRKYYLLAWGSELSKRRLKSVTQEWKKKYGQPGRDLQETIDQFLGAPLCRRRREPTAPIPDQLPSLGRLPLGRNSEIAALEQILRERQISMGGALIVLSGMAGVGKSTVAYRVAERVKELFPDGVLYANLQGFAGAAIEPADPERILDGFLAVLRVPYRDIGLDGKSAELRTALARRSVLLVLDDAVSTEQVVPLLPGVGTSAAIVTSRHTLNGLRSGRDSHISKIEPLGHEASMDILRESFSGDEHRKYQNQLTDLVRLCGHLPLALTVIARRLENRPRNAISALVRELAEEHRMLDALDLAKGELSVRLALDCSVRALSDNARRLLWQLAVHPGPSIGWEAVMDLGRADSGIRADRAVEELLAANLVRFSAERYYLHDLVRNYARYHISPVEEDSLEELEKETLRQTLEHQLQNVRACDRLLDRERMLPIGEPDGVSVIEPEGLEQAMAVLDDEYETVLHGIQLAIKKDQRRYIWLLPMVLVTYQWRRNRLIDALRDLQSAVEAAESIAAPVDCAMVYRMLAGTHWRREAFESAAGYLRRAIGLSAQDNTEAGLLSLARSRHALAITLRKQGSREDAEKNHRLALDLYRRLLDPGGEAASLNGIGTLHYDCGEYDEALRFCGEARRTVERTADWDGRADVLYTLAKIHTCRAERDEALSLFRRASEIYRYLDNKPSEEKCLRFYADVLVTAGHSCEAAEVLERVLLLRKQMGGYGMKEIQNRLEGLR